MASAVGAEQKMLLTRMVYRPAMRGGALELVLARHPGPRGDPRVFSLGRPDERCDLGGAIGHCEHHCSIHDALSRPLPAHGL